MMRNVKLIPVLVLLVFGVAASSPAMAQYRGHGGHGGVYIRGHGGAGLALLLGAALVGLAYQANRNNSAPADPDPVYAYPGPVVAPPHVQQVVPQAAPQAQADWYYCADSQTYYPYVRECPGGWQRVPSIPPR